MGVNQRYHLLHPTVNSGGRFRVIITVKTHRYEDRDRL